MGNCVEEGQAFTAMKIGKSVLSMVPAGDIAGQALGGIEGAANVVNAVEGAGNVVGVVGDVVGG